MSEWDCEHGRSNDAQSPCPLCEAELHIPSSMRPETRKLSLRDIDDFTRPLRTRIAELEKERTLVAQAYQEGWFNACAAAGVGRPSPPPLPPWLAQHPREEDK